MFKAFGDTAAAESPLFYPQLVVKKLSVNGADHLTEATFAKLIHIFLKYLIPISRDLISKTEV
jgi:hypothetical protein